jgi:hypothetical protein
VIGRKRPAPAGPNPWEEEGRRLAPLFGSVASAVVIANDAEAAAYVALGIARVGALERRVAVADLTGGTPTLVALAGDGDAHGITDSFLYGVSLNAVARPAADGTASLFILPCGSESAVPEEVLRSDRWRRLAAGFGDAGALLLIVARAGTPALAALVSQTDGAVSVGDAAIPLDWRVIAQAGDRTPLTVQPSAVDGTRRPWSAFSILSAALLAVTILIAVASLWPRGTVERRAPARAAATPAPTPASPALPTPPADTVRVSDPVNPPDSAIAAQFAVELVATNTATGANLWLRERGAPLPGVTVSPVLLGAARTRWHKVLAGAWQERMGADSLLAALRAEGILRPDAGVVVQVPLALLLEAGVPRGAAPARVAALGARGVPAYALVQDDGTVRLFAGAFETAAAAVPLDADLRALGLAPQLAYRTGRTF